MLRLSRLRDRRTLNRGSNRGGHLRPRRLHRFAVGGPVGLGGSELNRCSASMSSGIQCTWYISCNLTARAPFASTLRRQLLEGHCLTKAPKDVRDIGTLPLSGSRRTSLGRFSLCISPRSQLLLRRRFGSGFGHARPRLDCQKSLDMSHVEASVISGGRWAFSMAVASALQHSPF